MGQIGSGLGKVFNGNSDQVAGTGQSVGDLSSAGYSPQDIQGLGGGQASPGVAFARKALSGGLAGLGRGLSQQPQMQRPGGGGMMPGPMPTPPISPPIYNPDQQMNGPGNTAADGPGTGAPNGMPRRRTPNTLNFYGGQ